MGRQLLNVENHWYIDAEVVTRVAGSLGAEGLPRYLHSEKILPPPPPNAFFVFKYQSNNLFIGRLDKIKKIDKGNLMYCESRQMLSLDNVIRFHCHIYQRLHKNGYCYHSDNVVIFGLAQSGFYSSQLNIWDQKVLQI
jgi:hypothetical protein